MWCSVGNSPLQRLGRRARLALATQMLDAALIESRLVLSCQNLAIDQNVAIEQNISYELSKFRLREYLAIDQNVAKEQTLSYDLSKFSLRGNLAIPHLLA